MSDYPHDRLESIAQDIDDLAEELRKAHEEAVHEVEILDACDGFRIVFTNKWGEELLNINFDQEETREKLVTVFERIAPDASVNYTEDY